MKLIDYNDKIESLLNDNNPFAIITAAHLKTKATKNDPQARYSWKWTITIALYERGFSDEEILSIYRLVDWLMQLPYDLAKRFTDDLIVYEEEKKMAYITSVERIGIEKGLQEGMEKGIEKGTAEGMEKGMLKEGREMLLEALNVKFSNNVTADVHAFINTLNDRILLKRLLKIAIQSENLEAFKKTIQEIAPEFMTNRDN